MNKNKIFINIFSNWTNFVVMIGIAFFVSPIIVHNLGNENYGIWTLLVSVTGYFTVLDFGVNTAIVRYISKYTALGEKDKSRSVYNTSFLLFLTIASFLVVFAAVFAAFIGKIFNITSFSTSYIYIVFFLVALDLALGLLFSVLIGTMQALQEFFSINVISISVSIIKNLLIVIFLLQGFSLLTLAVIQISTSLLKYICQHYVIRTKYKFLFLDFSSCDKGMLKNLFGYSSYSFLIAVALKVLFYTDSIVIASLISVADVTYYAIASTIVVYLEQLVWSIVVVLIPIISAKEALGQSNRNSEIYLTGTKVTFFFSLPIIIVLFTAGGDFVKLWMGDEYGATCGKILKILLVGYAFGLSQLIAHGILKGISKHRILAFILCFQALLNLLISLFLAKPLGIYGVAIGTTIPLALCSIVFIPWYTCRNLGIDILPYLWKSYCFGTIIFLSMVIGYKYLNFSIDNYLELLSYSAVVAGIVWGIGFFYIVDLEHRKIIIKKISNRLFVD